MDFGCGNAASKIDLSRLFPHNKIVSVEHDFNLPCITRLLTQYNVNQKITYLLSPSHNQLPKDLGSFNFTVLSAIYEHLLPPERHILLPQLWSLLSTNWILFIDNTTHRYFPLEWHTTKLRFINYLSARLALIVACKFSKRFKQTKFWEILLRGGIRGGTEREIMGFLRDQGDSILLKPCRLRLHN